MGSETGENIQFERESIHSFFGRQFLFESPFENKKESFMHIDREQL